MEDSVLKPSTSNDDINESKEYWIKCSRDDLSGIPFMIENGYTPKFSDMDKRYKRINHISIPHDSVGFIKNNIHVWKLCKFVEKENSRFRDVVTYWKTAELIDGLFSNHKSFDTLDEVVKYNLNNK